MEKKKLLKQKQKQKIAKGGLGFKKHKMENLLSDLLQVIIQLTSTSLKHAWKSREKKI